MSNYDAMAKWLEQQVLSLGLVIIVSFTHASSCSFKFDSLVIELQFTLVKSL